MGKRLAGEKQALSVSVEFNFIAWFVDSIVFLHCLRVVVLVLDDRPLMLFDQVFNVDHASKSQWTRYLRWPAGIRVLALDKLPLRALPIIFLFFCGIKISGLFLMSLDG